MRFSTSLLDEVRDRIALSSIVARRVQWDRKKTNPAKRDYWAPCPFHSEKTPSFHVDDRKGIYHCFGCGVTGDHFKFLMTLEGRSFPEAVEELAAQAGVQLPAETPEAREKAARRLTLVEANDKAMKWFEQQLTASPEAKAYLAFRGITPAEVKQFRLGYAPDANALKGAGLGDERDLADAGLLGRSDGRTFDWFRNRLIFPVLDAKGHALGFSGRAMGVDQEPKYLNTSETPIFDKGTVMFNGAAAKEAAWNGAQYVVVEGNVDVIAACRAGMAAAAPMGTALTEPHVKMMAKATDDAVMCFDGDAAGRKATFRAVDLILPAVSPAFSVRFAELPDGLDPDTMVKRSADGFVQAIKAAAPMGDVLWRRETLGINTALPEQRAKLEANLRTALKTIQDVDTRRAYGLDFKDRLAQLGKRPTVYRSNSYSQHSTSPSAGRLLTGFRKTVGLSLKEAILISAIAAAPHAALDLAETLGADERLSAEAQQLIGKIVMAMAGAPDQAITEILDAAGLADVVQEALDKASGAGVIMKLGSEDAAALSVLQGTAWKGGRIEH